MTNPCRHFCRPDLILNKGGCDLGHPIREIIEKKTNAPISTAMGRLCCAGNGTDLLDCPDADFKTDEEIEAEREKTRDALDRMVAALPKFYAIKEALISEGETHQIADCPLCGAIGAMRVRVNIHGNKHMHARCESCGNGLIE